MWHKSYTSGHCLQSVLYSALALQTPFCAVWTFMQMPVAHTSHWVPTRSANQPPPYQVSQPTSPLWGLVGWPGRPAFPEGLLPGNEDLRAYDAMRRESQLSQHDGPGWYNKKSKRITTFRGRRPESAVRSHEDCASCPGSMHTCKISGFIARRRVYPMQHRPGSEVSWQEFPLKLIGVFPQQL